MRFRRTLICTAGALLLTLAARAGADPAPRRVLLLYSYEREFSHNTFARLFRPELARTSPHPIDFVEISLQAVRTSRSESDAAILDNLRGSISGRPLDLVIPIGGPAASFAQKHRAELFPHTPTLYAAVDSRFVQAGGLGGRETAVMVRNDPVQMIDSMLALMPETRHIMVVIGASPLEKFWLDVVKHAFQRFEGRVTFSWTNEMSLAQLLQRSGSLPPHSAIFYGILSMDATGAPQMEEPALDALHAAANAPMFGLHSHQLGHGIVGGALLSLDDISRETTATALRLLNSEPPASIPPRTLVAGAPTFDARELRRWNIPRGRLPASPTLFFNEAPTSRLRAAVVTATAVIAVQVALFATIVVTRRRRNTDPIAGGDGLATQAALRRLTQRLIQSHEYERASISTAIHDDVCQQLTGLTLRLHALSTEVEAPRDDIREEMRELCEQYFALEREMLAISDPLYPRLKLLGLAETARLYCERQCAAHGLALEFHDGTISLGAPDDVALTVFRVLQEAIENVVAHAHASRLTVALREHGGAINVTVEDDGVGFDPEAALRGTAVGLVAIRERLRLAGGTCTFNSQAGGGTRILASVPLRAALAHA